MFPDQNYHIVFLGNSITAYADWPVLLNRQDVLNRGIPGDHCDGIRARLSEIVKWQPTRMYLMAGINDLAYHSVDVTFEKYKKLIGAILKEMPGIILYLQSVLPVNNVVYTTSIHNEDVRLLNERIRDLAVENGLTYIDIHSALLDADGNLDASFTEDGVHLNDSAYLKWKEVLVNYL